MEKDEEGTEGGRLIRVLEWRAGRLVCLRVYPRLEAHPPSRRGACSAGLRRLERPLPRGLWLECVGLYPI